MIMFLRRPSLPWGVGLLTVTTAVLLDTILGTFNQEALLADLGFFFYVLAGMLFGGAAFWLLGVLGRPVASQEAGDDGDTAVAPATHNPHSPHFEPFTDEAGTVYNRQLMADEMTNQLSREDVIDILFDLSIPENEVMCIPQTMSGLIGSIMQYTETYNQTPQLALAVERILTPPAADSLPRLEKITADSPPPILRYYLLAHTNLAQLQAAAVHLQIDWEQLAGANKQTKVRELLLYLKRRNHLDELVAYLPRFEVIE
ncbi:MAG: hypothetical protein GY796_18665 [Chloroflexi bacterium]|nr:hypothetical protein [Chloroflexota bacterium]